MNSLPSIKSALSENEPLSFWDYKINYNNRLGEGVFGEVYDVVERPEKEKGYLPYLFPFLYDFLFRVDKKEEQPSLFCIKISKSPLRILSNFEIIDNDILGYAIRSFSERSKEQESNKIAFQYNLTTVKFYPTHSLYAQFKTKVNGFTFGHYYDEQCFFKEGHFPLRKSFVEFMTLIENPKIVLADIHANNIMYDEIKQRWEIVDGVVKEVIKKDGDNIPKFIKNLGLPMDQKITKYVFTKLSKIAQLKIEYQEPHESKLLKKISQILPT